MSQANSTSQATRPSPHPVALVVTDDLKRSRLTVFFRMLLVIPHLIWLGLWGFAAELVLVVAWLVGIVAGRIPQGIHNFLAGYVRYATRVTAYMLLLANPYPPFSSAYSYPIDAEIPPAAEQRRLTVLFRILLAVPAILLSYVFRIVNNLIAFLGWFYALILGRMSEGMRNTSAWLLRYELQTYAYIFLLTGRYPSLGSGPTV